MQDTKPFSPAEMRELRKLLEIEKIRKVAQLYSHLVDVRDFAGMAALYAEDAIAEWGPFGSLKGRDQIHAQLLASKSASRLPYDGFHITTNLWIEMTGTETAVSRSYVTDVWPSDERGPVHHPGFPENPVLLYGVYENEYRKIGDEWKISRSNIQMTWPDRKTTDAFPAPMSPTAIG